MNESVVFLRKNSETHIITSDSNISHKIQSIYRIYVHTSIFRFIHAFKIEFSFRKMFFARSIFATLYIFIKRPAFCRTNKGIVVRVGKDQSTFRLAFISNSDFQQDEFDSWMRRIHLANMKPPTLNFVRDKAAEITEAINRPIRDERVVEQVCFTCACINFIMI